MTEASRYAIYFAPAADTALWSFGSRVLQYDAASGLAIPGFAPPGVTVDAWSAMTERPRTYGFHATLKAPFTLQDRGEAELRDALDAFARTRAPVRLGPMRIDALPSGAGGMGFVAMTPVAPPPELAALERDIVIGLDRFRAPLSSAERKARKPERLTERQRRYLDAYGYPYVLEDFRFHMTLSGEIAEAATVALEFSLLAAQEPGVTECEIDAICLFRQEARSSRFRIISRHALGG
jgi:2'-5' RNA ligase